MTQFKSLLSVLLCLTVVKCAERQYGTVIGDLFGRAHGVSGRVYAVDSKTIFIKGLTYDGQGPDAYFYAGSSSQPSSDGFKIPNEAGSTGVLKAYNSKDIVLTLPNGKTLRDVKWISVWCDAFSANFGEVYLPERLAYPKPRKIGHFEGIHNVKSGRVVVVDAQTFLIPKFNYDGQAPDAHFWVGRGPRPGPEGNLVMDENGSDQPLKQYTEKTLVIVLPGDMTVYDIDWISVWCVAFFADFGSVKIPKDLNVPPSLRMLGIEPQTKLNCEILDPERGFEVRWAIAGRSIVTQLVARLEDGEYMGFGLSGNPRRSRMVGSDATIAWLDQKSGRGYAIDYYLDDKSQCSGNRGSCPDNNLRSGSNSIRLLNSAVINKFTMLTYRQPLKASDEYDIDVSINGSQPIIWAIGPINDKGEVSYHSKRLQGDLKLSFGRIPQWNCPIAGKPSKRINSSPSIQPAKVKVSKQPWFIPNIPCNEPEDGFFFAQIGPTGGEQGYSSITGHVGWGIAWYINGLLIPEIHVVRGKTYTFVVEGGNNPNSPAQYHPFYITDDPEGGYEFKNAEERNSVRVFAGVDFRGAIPKPSSVGRLCQWKESPDKPAHLSSSFGEYQRSLHLKCSEGQPGIVQWTPDANTPDTVYYQCFTHRFLGWKIRVKDSCDS